MKIKPIPILYVIASLHIGGTELQLKLLVEGLDKSLFQPVICATTMGGPLEDDFKRMNVPVYILEKKHKLDFSILRKLNHIISMHKPKILHCFLFTANFWGRWAAHYMEIPVIISSERSMVPYMNYIYMLIDCWQNRYSDCIVVNAQAVKSCLIEKEKIKRDMIDVIPNGINMTRFNLILDTPEEIKNKLKEKYGISSGSYVIGNVCRISPWKDLEVFIRAAYLVKKDIPNTKFVIVGEAVLSDEIPYKEKIMSLIKELNLSSDFVFTGKSDEVPQLLAIFDVFVQSSWTEGFPNAVMEAMAMAKPVVATSVGGTSELVIHDMTGFLVPPKDPKMMAERILSLCGSEEMRKKMGQAGRDRIIENFSAERMVTQTQNLYLRLLQQKGLI